MHLPLFGTMAKALRREQAIFLLDQQGFEVNATDSVRSRQQVELQQTIERTVCLASKLGVVEDILEVPPHLPWDLNAETSIH